MGYGEKSLLSGGGSYHNPGIVGWFSRNKLIILSWIGLIVACLEKIINGSIFSFSVYLNDLKSTFNFTQTEIEVIVSSANIGQGLAVFPGLFFDRFGPKLSCALGLVLSCGSMVLLWSATTMIEFYHSNYFLVAFYFALAGFGSMFGYISSLNTTIVNFDVKWRGKIIGVLDALFAGSPLIFSLIYYNLFTKTDEEGGELTNNLPGFFILLAVSFGIIDSLCFIFSRFNYSNEHAKGYEDLADQRNKVNHEEIRDASVEFDRTKPQTDLSMWQLVKNEHYNIYLWTFVILGSVDTVCLNNITTASKSLGHIGYDVILIPALAGSTAVCSCVTGILVDYFHSDRLYFQVFASLMACIAMLFYVVGSEIIGLFIFTAILVGIPSGIMWVSVPVEVSERFGTANFGRNWGFIRVAQCVFMYFLQYMFGYFYELGITDHTSIDCYGYNCVRWGYLFMFLIAILSLGIYTGRLIKVYRKRKYKKINALG